MPVFWLRSGLLAAVVLSLGVAANLLALQGAGERARSGKLRHERGAVALAPAGPSPGQPAASAPARTVAPAVARATDPTPPSSETPETIRAIQRELQARGYEAGAADGVPRLVTRAAIMAYEHDNGLPLSGAADEALLKAVVLGGAHAGAGPPAVAAPGPHAAQVTRTVQQWLAGLGYAPGPADGRFREETARALRAFEIDQRMPATGRISGPLVARLARAAGQGRLASGR
jgi:peptidoglycan hydrolase-like protein with peptidoglycan-binding domain